ncbi:MAG: helix-turn-helix domain-containing protein [Thiolinea sp.]
MLTKIASSKLPIDQFEADLMSACGSFQLESGFRSKDIHGLVHLEHLADLEIAHVAKDLHSIRRTKKDLARDEGENFFLIIQEEGQAMMSQHDNSRVLIPGDMILIDSAYVSEFSFFGRFSRQLSIHLSREEMLQRFGVHAKGGKFISKTDHTAIAVAAILTKAYQVQHNEHQSHYLKEAIFGLIGSILYEQSDYSNGKDIDAEVGGAQLLERGMAFINEHFTDPKLTCQRVADSLGVSIRHLQRAFSLVGSTPSDYLTTRRLEHACLMLKQRDEQETCFVSTIAYKSGFNDISNFNRQFRKAFNCPPSRYQ